MTKHLEILMVAYPSLVPNHIGQFVSLFVINVVDFIIWFEQAIFNIVVASLACIQYLVIIVLESISQDSLYLTACLYTFSFHNISIVMFWYC